MNVRSWRSNSPVNLADLREPISLVRASSVPDTESGWVDKVKPYAQMRAGVDEGTYSVQGDKISSSDLFVFVVRYDPDLRPAVGDWIVWGREVFAVRGFRRRANGIAHTEFNATHYKTLPEDVEEAVEVDNTLDTSDTQEPHSTDPSPAFWNDEEG